MRLLLPTLLGFALLAAGCLASPIQDAEAAHGGKSCPSGAVVHAFDAEGAPVCQPPHALAGQSCGKGEVVTGFSADARPVCRPILDVAQEAMPPEPEQPPHAARSLALTSAGALSNGWKNYTVAAASMGMTYASLTFTVDGAALTLDLARASCGELASASGYGVCQNGVPITLAANEVRAGDVVTLQGLSSGQTLRILDVQANAVMLTLTVG